MDSAVSIQSQVKDYLVETGRKKKWLASQLGISPALLSQWLMGKTAFSDNRINSIMEIMRNNA